MSTAEDRGPLAENIQIDSDNDIVTIYGVKVAGAVLRTFTENTPIGTWFRVVNVHNGIATIETRREESSAGGSDAQDAARYRWLRSEDTATNPLYYPFWQEFNAKLCREDQMDALIDSAMSSRTVVPPLPKVP